MYEEQFIDTNHVRLHVIFAGPQDGKPIILLHGFPEFWYGWRHQIEPLAAAGYRVIVPDQRGYNTSGKPSRVKHYHINQLTADIIGLIDRLGYEQVTIVGHDWGGVVAWQLITDYPKRFLKAVILNAPHLDALKSALMRNPIQFIKSWYIYVIQLPFLAEAIFRPFARWAMGTGSPGSFTAEDMARYEEVWALPGTVTSIFNWYRSAFREFMGDVSRAIIQLKSPWSLFETSPINVPTLILWGVQDVALTRQLAYDSAAACKEAMICLFEDASHWLQHDKPQDVTRMILEFAGEEMDSIKSVK